MKEDNYKAEFEEHRKEISLDNDHEESLPSRAAKHRKGNVKKKKRSSHTMINVLLGLFTLIPILIFLYVLSNFYSPGDSNPTKVEDLGVVIDSGSKVSSEKMEPSHKEIAQDDDEEKKNENLQDANQLETSGEVVSAPSIQKVPPVEKPAPKPESKPEPKPESKPESKPEPKPEPKPAVKTHTVGGNENLYRISLKYYNSGDGVEKIKKANGLTSDNIRVGQTLIIP
ncbi:LysM peptidoglycan-binding domain-containing protein [Sporosarcina sp. HYO08]|uniref:LysM peptidoglycan-binding domain-containing protein n=1 Tax=Sporosarcina sp. HYO08 TaxID=1759557 RepID=UPI00079BA8E2|nr:LysM peptidoglycan-binding domain-containing protein [Sporosarcina sp. HYO08]KXH82042.1 hypothetical protein AU377_07260 [Sporosarcina sp. HYO08]